MCLPCPNKKITFTEVFFLICFVAMLYYIIWWKYNGQIYENHERPPSDVILSRMKLVLGFYQVVGLYVVSLHDLRLEGTMHTIGEIISVIHLNILKFFIRPHCISDVFVTNPKAEFVISVVAFLVCTALPVFFYHIMRALYKMRHNRMICNEKTKSLRAKTSTSVIILLFITYPTICTRVFQIYPGACETFCLDMNNAHCFSVLRSDYDVRCDDQFKLYQTFAVMASFSYVLAFPLILLRYLRKYCSKSVYQGKGRNNPANTIDKNEESLPLSSNSRCCLPPCLKFLCENYKPHYWYWEVMELVRKVAQTALITLLGWNNKFTVLLTIGISIFFLTLHARCRPMKSVGEQHLQMFSLAAILTNIVSFAVEIPDVYNDDLSWFLVVLNISLPIFTILEVFFVVVVGVKNKLLHTMKSQDAGARKEL